MKFISVNLSTFRPRLERRACRGSRWALGVNLLLIGGMLVLPMPGRAGTPEHFVQDLNLRFTSELGQPDLGEAERRMRFAQLLDRSVDLSAAGALMLGPRWAKASTEDRDRFCAAFRDYLIANLASHFHGTGEREVHVTAIEDNGPVTTVVTQLSGPFGGSASIEWRLVPDGSDDWRLTNLTVAGMNLAAFMRSQFSAVLSQGGPGLDPVITLLHDRQGE